MGSYARRKPVMLAAKLRELRTSSGLSQAELCNKLNDPQYPLYEADISNFELGKREPSLIVLLGCGRLANVILDILVDDEN